MKAWTDKECLVLLRPFASGVALMSPDIMFSPHGLYALIRAAVAETRREQREKFLAAAKDLHMMAKHVGDFEVCLKHKCVHLRESAILADKEPTDGRCSCPTSGHEDGCYMVE